MGELRAGWDHPTLPTKKVAENRMECGWSRWAGYLGTLVTMASAHQEQIFRRCKKLSPRHETKNQPGGEEAERKGTRQNRIQREFSGCYRPIFSAEQKEREKTAKGKEHSGKGREVRNNLPL